MPGTVNHVFTSPVADATGVVTYGNSTYNASALVKPSDWNSAHVVTFSAVGSEISGAFSNVPGGVSFGLETNGFITGGAPAGGGGITNINVSAGTQSANLSNLVFLNTSGVGGVGGVSFGLSASSITGSVNAYPLITDGATRTPNGFPDRTQFTYSWSDATRTLTITPTGANFVVWSNGKRYVKSVPQDFVFVDVEGRQYAYFDDNGDPQTTTTFSTDLILRWAITGILYWDAVGNMAVPDLQAEYHGTDWPPEVHLQQHLTVGCVFQSGLDLTLTPDQDGSSLTHVEFIGAQGYIWDEDIQHNIASKAAATALPVLYKTGSSLWRYDNSSAAVVRSTGTGRAAWNKDTAGTWSLAEMTEGYFGVAHICVGSGLTKQWFVVMGAAEYETLDEATTAAKVSPDMLGLPFQEFRIVGSVVFETSDTFTNAVKSRVRYMTDGADWVDWRNERTVASEVSSGGGGVQIVAGGQTFANGAVSFGNSNGFSFLTNNGSVVGSYTVPSVPAQSVQPVAISGSNGSFAFSTLSMGNSNGLTFYSTNGSIVGSYTVPTQSQFVLSNSNGISFGTNGSTVTATVKTDYAGTGFTGVNATGTLNSNGLSLSVAAGGGGADGYNILAAGTQTANTTGTVAFLNSNGITFGMSNNSQITASHNAITSQSNPTLDDVQDLTNDKLFFMNTRQLQLQWGTNLTAFTTATNRQGLFELDIVGGTNFATASSLKVDGLHIHQSVNNPFVHLVHLQADGTNAIPLHIEQAGAVAIELNAPLSYDGGSVPMILGTSQSNLVANLNANYLQGKVSSEFQSTGNYLTTAAQSNHSHGNPTLALTNLSGTTASASNGFTLSLSAAAGGGGADGYNIIGVNGGATQLSTTYQLSNANNITFGLNAGTITASASYPAQTVQPVAVSGSNGSFAFSTLTLGNSNGVSFYSTNGSIVASYTVPAVPASYVSQVNGSSGALSFAVGSSLSASSNASTITFGLASNITTALQSAGAYLTTAANSTHSHGNPTLALTNINGTTASASNGLTLSLSAVVPAQTNQTANFYVSGNTTQLSSTAGLDLRSVSFEGAGIASVGVSNGRVLVSVPSGGGGGDGYNIVSLGATGTTGTAWSSLSASVALNGSGGVVVSQNNSNQIVVSGVQSYLTAGTNITLSSAGSTISIIGAAGGGGGATYPGVQPYDDFVQVVGQVGQGSLLFDPQPLPNVSFDRYVLLLQNTNSSNSSGSHTLSFWVGLYTRNGSTLSLAYSASATTAITHSGTAGSYASYSGKRAFPITITPTSIAEGRYWIGFVSRTTSGGANGSYSNYLVSNLNSNFIGMFGEASNATKQPKLGQGFYSATTSGMPASVAFSQINGTNSLALRMPVIGFGSGTV